MFAINDKLCGGQFCYIPALPKQHDAFQESKQQNYSRSF